MPWAGAIGRSKVAVSSTVAGSKATAKHLNRILRASKEWDGSDEARLDPAKNAQLRKEIKAARNAMIPDAMIQRTLQFAGQGYKFPALLRTVALSQAFATISSPDAKPGKVAQLPPGPTKGTP